MDTAEKLQQLVTDLQAIQKDVGDLLTENEKMADQVNSAECDKDQADYERDEAVSELAEFSDELADLRRNAPPPPSYPPSVGRLPFEPFPRDYRRSA